MRVLMLNYEFPPLGGGAGNATYYLLKKFLKYPDLKIDLVTSSTDKYKKVQLSDNIRIFFLDIKKSQNLHRQSNRELITYAWKSYFFSRNLLKKERYTLIHAFQGMPGGYIALKLNTPYIVSLRGSDVPFYNPRYKLLDSLFFKRMAKKIWRNAKEVITNSKGLKELALKTKLDQNISIIPNGVEIEEFYPAKKDDSVFKVLSTSRFIRRKGIEYLIEGFFNFQKNKTDVKLILLGNGNLEEELKSRVNKLNIRDKVEFMGTIDHQKIIKYYQVAHVFVLPSLNEGMSNSVLEAMACGLPIMVTDTGGTKELIDSENGIIIRKKNSQDINDTLQKIYSDKSLSKKMGLASRKKAEQMSWQITASKYYEIYKKSLAKNIR